MTWSSMDSYGNQYSRRRRKKRYLLIRSVLSVVRGSRLLAPPCPQLTSCLLSLFFRLSQWHPFILHQYSLLQCQRETSVIGMFSVQGKTVLNMHTWRLRAKFLRKKKVVLCKMILILRNVQPFPKEATNGSKRPLSHCHQSQYQLPPHVSFSLGPAHGPSRKDPILSIFFSQELPFLK